VTGKYIYFGAKRVDVMSIIFGRTHKTLRLPQRSFRLVKEENVATAAIDF